MQSTILWRSGLVAAAAVGLLLGCVGNVDGAGDDSPGDPPVARRYPDGSVRIPFLGGAFVTKNGEMPVEVEQAIAGEPTDHPVVVLAGDGAGTRARKRGPTTLSAF